MSSLCYRVIRTWGTVCTLLLLWFLSFSPNKSYVISKTHGTVLNICDFFHSRYLDMPQTTECLKAWPYWHLLHFYEKYFQYSDTRISREMSTSYSTGPENIMSSTWWTGIILLGIGKQRGTGEKSYEKGMNRNFAGGPEVKNPPSNAGVTGLIPSGGTKISHASGQLSLHATTTELTPQWESPRTTNYRAHVLWSLCATTRKRKPARHN